MYSYFESLFVNFPNLQKSGPLRGQNLQNIEEHQREEEHLGEEKV